MTTDPLRCPECDAPLERNLGRVPAAVTADTVRLAVDCPACAEHIELVAPRPAAH